jgi:hypothetical protein
MTVGNYFEMLKEHKVAFMTEVEYKEYLDKIKKRKRVAVPFWCTFADLEYNVNLNDLEYKCIKHIDTSDGEDVVLFVLPDDMSDKQFGLIEKAVSALHILYCSERNPEIETSKAEQ